MKEIMMIMEKFDMLVFPVRLISIWEKGGESKSNGEVEYGGDEKKGVGTKNEAEAKMEEEERNGQKIFELIGPFL
ncbi:MAG: hypothetical protein HY769_03390 [Candidatus Stahlbacteria bacterium]|nr:hypothetical protein [Candidatus Stahlbacteria bacterium]